MTAPSRIRARRITAYDRRKLAQLDPVNGHYCPPRFAGRWALERLAQLGLVVERETERGRLGTLPIWFLTERGHRVQLGEERA